MKVALVCCGRLENRYAVEFVEYYKQLGFDHIFIADNNHEGEEHFEDVLQLYVDEGFVTICDFRKYKSSVQYTAYLNIYYEISKDYDWVVFFDFDEYLTLVKDKTIKDYLSRNCFKNYNQILINWKTYTDNNLVYDDGRPCLERFTTPLENDKMAEGNEWCITNEVVKPIIRTKLNNLTQPTVHYFLNIILKNSTCNSVGEKNEHIQNKKPHYWQPINYELAYIKHFPTKTIDEWINNKMVRGTGDRSFRLFKETYNIKRFFDYNKITKEKLQYLKEHNIKIY